MRRQFLHLLTLPIPAFTSCPLCYGVTFYTLSISLHTARKVIVSFFSSPTNEMPSCKRGFIILFLSNLLLPAWSSISEWLHCQEVRIWGKWQISVSAHPHILICMHKNEWEKEKKMSYCHVTAKAAAYNIKKWRLLVFVWELEEHVKCFCPISR